MALSNAAEAAFKAAGGHWKAGFGAISPMLRAGAFGAGAGIAGQWGYNRMTGHQGGYKRSALLGFAGGAGYRGFGMGPKGFADAVTKFGTEMKGFYNQSKLGFSSLNP